jgi:hypothetical protein
VRIVFQNDDRANKIELKISPAQITAANERLSPGKLPA